MPRHFADIYINNINISSKSQRQNLLVFFINMTWFLDVVFWSIFGSIISPPHKQNTSLAWRPSWTGLIFWGGTSITKRCMVCTCCKLNVLKNNNQLFQFCFRVLYIKYPHDSLLLFNTVRLLTNTSFYFQLFLHFSILPFVVVLFIEWSNKK